MFLTFSLTFLPTYNVKPTQPQVTDPQPTDPQPTNPQVTTPQPTQPQVTDDGKPAPKEVFGHNVLTKKGLEVSFTYLFLLQIQVSE